MINTLGYHLSTPQSMLTMWTDFWGTVNHHTIIWVITVVIWWITGYGIIVAHSKYLLYAGSLYNKPGSWLIHWDPTHQHLKYTNYRTRFERNYETPCHPLYGISCDIVNLRLCMCFHLFQVSCRHIGKLWQAWGIINTLGSHSPTPYSTQTVGPELVVTANTIPC